MSQIAINLFSQLSLPYSISHKIAESALHCRCLFPCRGEFSASMTLLVITDMAMCLINDITMCFINEIKMCLINEMLK